MAGRGPAPKPAAERRRRNKSEPEIVVSSDGELHGPDLPEGLDWPAATLAWWLTWRRAPQAATFTETDWAFLLDTAVMHAQYWQGGLRWAGELRVRVAKFGATPEDRMRLKLSIGEPTPAPAPPTPTTKGRKERLLKAVADG